MWFVGILSTVALESAAESLDGVATNQAPLDFLEFLGDLDSLLGAAKILFSPSGIQAEELAHGEALRFLPCAVRYGQFPPGCFRQRSRGIDLYIFVDDNGTTYAIDRWLAIHAELDRRRRNGLRAKTPVAWDPTSNRLAVACNAQLPTAWSRAAILSTGLPPRTRSTIRRCVDRRL